MAAGPAALTGFSTVVQAVGALKGGKGDSRAAAYNADIAKKNAVLARQQAQAEVVQLDRETRLRLGDIRAAAGGAGVQLDGSVLDILGDVAAQSELERQNAVYAGELRAMGFDSTAAMETQRGKAARATGFIRAGTALLSGGAQTWQMADEAGLFKLKREK